MNDGYDDLSSEQIRVMAVKDAEHSGDMAEQARVLRDMARDLQDAVDKVRGHSEALFGKGILTSTSDSADDGAWSGHSARMMTVELRRLYKTFDDAPDKLKTNGDTLDRLTTKVQDTNIALDKLTTGSKSASAKDTEARRIMSDAASSYVDTANGLAEPKFYTGMRKKDPEDSGDDWTRQHGTPRSTPATPTTPSHPGTATEPGATTPTDPGSPASHPIPASDPNPTDPGDPGDPTLQGPAPVPTAPPAVPPAPAPPPAPSPTPIPPVAPPITGPAPYPPVGRPPTPPVTGRPPLSPPVTGRPPYPTRPMPSEPFPLEPTPRPTVPPVIGRPPTSPPVEPPVGRPTPPLEPGPLTRPVIGGRGGPAPYGLPPQRTVPGTPPNGIVRPVIGGRGGPLPYGTRPGGGPMGEPAPLARPVIGMRPGTSPEYGYPPTGPTNPGRGTNRAVIGRRPNTRPAGPGEEPEALVGRSSTGRPQAAIETEPVEAPPRRGWTRSPIRLRQAEPEPTPVEEALEPVGKPPGQRVPARPLADGPAVERAVIRGSAPVPGASDAPGQDVFARAARERDKAEAESALHVTDGEADEEWHISRATVRGVITGSARQGRA